MYNSNSVAELREIKCFCKGRVSSSNNDYISTFKKHSITGRAVTHSFSEKFFLSRNSKMSIGISTCENNKLCRKFFIGCFDAKSTVNFRYTRNGILEDITSRHFSMLLEAIHNFFSTGRNNSRPILNLVTGCKSSSRLSSNYEIMYFISTCVHPSWQSSTSCSYNYQFVIHVYF